MLVPKPALCLFPTLSTTLALKGMTHKALYSALLSLNQGGLVNI